MEKELLLQSLQTLKKIKFYDLYMNIFEVLD